MREHPILFSAPMIRALLAGRKSVTRRLSKQWLKVKDGDRLWVRETFCLESCREVGYYPPPFSDGRPIKNHDDEDGIWWEQPHYRATDPTPELDIGTGDPGVRWTPCIHMPRWASRITLEATEDARVERLWDITDEEARREGVQVLPLQSPNDPSAWWQVEPGEHQARTPRDSFRSLWQSLHAKPGERWEDNPELVRIAFRRVG